MAGADLILGVAWLRTRGPILADFAVPQLSFTHGPKTITLRGESNPTAVSTHLLKTLITKESMSSFHAIYFHFEPNINQQANPTHTDPTIAPLLTKFSSIFSTPTTLPPFRFQDHHIPTLPTAAPVNVKLYRYPHYLKQIMTTMISEMLAEGVIKPSQSPYSSSVLLVKKGRHMAFLCGLQST